MNSVSKNILPKNIKINEEEEIEEIGNNSSLQNSECESNENDNDENDNILNKIVEDAEISDNYEEEKELYEEDIEMLDVNEWKNDEQYTNNLIVPEYTNEKICGAKLPNSLEITPYNLFTLYFDKEIMNFIVKETNSYYQECHILDDKSNEKRSHMRKWTDITCEEMYLFFGTIISMGILKHARIKGIIFICNL